MPHENPGIVYRVACQNPGCGYTFNLRAGARRPFIILGKGAAYAQADDDIRSFVEMTSIPYLPMSMAKGLIPDNHVQSAAAARSLVLAQADVVMLICETEIVGSHRSTCLRNSESRRL
jgi:glyoxylate carboligase